MRETAETKVSERNCCAEGDTFCCLFIFSIAKFIVKENVSEAFQ